MLFPTHPPLFFFRMGEGEVGDGELYGFPTFRAFSYMFVVVYVMVKLDGMSGRVRYHLEGFHPRRV